MTTEHDPLDLPDTDLQALFAAVQPAADFEDRLISAVRQQRQLRLPTIPVAVRKAAIAAAAVLMVGTTGYFGNRVMLGQSLLGNRVEANSAAVASNLHQMGLTIDLYQNAGRSNFDTSTQGDPFDTRMKGIEKSRKYTQSDQTRFSDGPEGQALASRTIEETEKSTDQRELSPLSATGQERDKALAGLIKDARQLTDQGRYAHAKSVIDNIKRLDPENAYANGVGPFLEDKVSTKPRKDAKYRDIEYGSVLNDSKDGGSQAAKPSSFGPADYGLVPTVNGDSLKVQGQDASRDGSEPFYIGGHFVNSGTTIRSTPQSGSPRDNLDSVVLPPANDGPQPATIVAGPADTSKSPQPVPSRDKELQDQPSAGVEKQINEANATRAAAAKNVTAALSATESNTTGAATTTAVDDRKIIRTGTMEFEVDRFDTAQMQITKIVGELGGFVGATDSQKLPNGKVRGSISVRVAPERLDTLVLSLRALGDLKAQQITASDITKEYTDIQSELAADRAMQDRLLQLIHDGKGTVKDLLAAENELGTWRTKIEKAEGMIRYYNGQVALSTLTITLSERDIQTPATAVETETADVGIEADDVEKARNSALKAIDDVKGRIVEAELKRFDAGQLAARLVADVPPESAGAVIDQLKQLGKVARLEVHRQQSSSDGLPVVMMATLATADAVTADYTIVDHDLLSVSIEDLEALGKVTTKEVRVDDKGEITLPLLGQFKAAGITTGQLQRAISDAYKNKKVLTNAQVTVKVSEAHGTPATGPSASMINPIRLERKPTRLLISIYNLANVAPRRTTNVTLAATDVETAYAALVSVAKSSGGRVVTSALDRGDPIKATASLVLELPPEKFEDAIKTLHAQGDVLSLNLTENPDTQNSTEAKTGLTIKMFSLANVAPRHTTSVVLAADDVDAAYTALAAVAKSTGGRVVTSALDRGDPAKATGSLVLEFPPDKLDTALTTMHAQGGVLKSNLSENTDTQNSTESKQGLTVRLIAMATVEAREKIEQTLAASDVPAAYQAILTAANLSHCRVAASALDEKDRQNIVGEIQLDVPRTTASELEKSLNAAGGTIARTSSRSADTENTVDSKVQLKLLITSADHLPARETTRLQVEVSDVDKSSGNAQAAAIAAGGRVLEANINRDHGKGIARVILDFPLAKSSEMLQAIRGEGTVRGIDSSRDQAAPAGPMAHGQIYVEFRTGEAIVADNSGPWASVREGLSTSISGLLWSLKLLVMGLCFLGPWVGLGWIGWKITRKIRRPKVEGMSQ